jgi:hypothetical protein
MLAPGMSTPAQAPRTTELIRDTLESIQGDTVGLGELVDRFEQRGFGVLLLFLSLPAFIPVPGVAGVTGPVIALLGLQMLIGLRRPWLPGFVRRKTIGKQTFARFTARMGRLLKVLERFCQPRITWLFDQAGSRASGLVLILYGLLLSLPIPFTNYIFGLVLLSIAIAMIERDGLLLVSSWFIVGPLVLAVGILLRKLKAWRLRRRRRNGHDRSAGRPRFSDPGQEPPRPASRAMRSASVSTPCRIATSRSLMAARRNSRRRRRVMVVPSLPLWKSMACRAASRCRNSASISALVAGRSRGCAASPGSAGSWPAASAARRSS